MSNYELRQNELNVPLKTCDQCDLVWVEGTDAPTLDSIITGDNSHAPPPAPTRHESPLGKLFTTEPLTETGWKLIPALIGLPIECGTSKLKNHPIATWITTALLVAVLIMIMGKSDLEALKKVVNHWALLPGQPFRNGGLTIITSFFLHAGWAHLLGNIYFLLVFGDDMEDSLGWIGFIALLTAGHIGGMMLQLLVTSHWDIPILGASAGISAVLGCYAIIHAKKRLGWFVMVPFTWRCMILRVPALAVLAAYAGLQAFHAIQAAGQEGGGVAYSAHLGGLAVGALWGMAVMHRKNAPEQTKPI